MANDLVAAARSIIESQQVEFERVCVDNQIAFAREAGFAMQILQGNEYTMGVAVRNPMSLKAAITNVAAIGISLNPASKLAYLVPRKGTVCLDISYMGMMHLAQQCGAIQWGQAAIVREKDLFELNGLDKLPTHKYNPFGTDRGEIVGAYCVVKTDTGDYLTATMPIDQIYSIRDRSEAWKAGKQTPWKTDPEEMIKKTVVKNASKYWPRRDRLDNAVHYLNTDGGEGIEKDVAPAQELTEEQRAKREELDQILAGCQTRDEIVSASSQIKTQCESKGDRESWAYFQSARSKRVKEIEAAQ